MSGNSPKTNRLPVQYSPYEGIDAIIRGDLYPKPYSVQYPPVAPTAYQPKTFEKMLDIYNSGDQKKIDSFRERNSQRVSGTDLNDMARDDLLAMRSAVLAEALERGRGSGMYTGKNWVKPGEREEYPVGALGASFSNSGRWWASNDKNFDQPWTSTAGHEALHKYFDDQSVDMDNGLDARKSQMLPDGDFQHALINTLYHKLSGQGRDEVYKSGPGYETILEMMERAAERRIGKKNSEKNQGRISSR